MSEHEFTFGGHRYRIVAPFDAGSALSAARRLRVLAEYLSGAPFAGDPTTPDDGWCCPTCCRSLNERTTTAVVSLWRMVERFTMI